MKKSKNEAQPETEKKKQPSKAGAVIGSILLFLLTFVMALLFLFSVLIHSSLTQRSFSTAFSETELSEADVTQQGTTQSLGKWIYDWYLWDAPNLTEEYAETALEQPEVSAYFYDYLSQMEKYLLWKTDKMPTMDVDEIADILQVDITKTMKRETGVTFSEADRSSLHWTMDDDVNALNDGMETVVGHGVGKFVFRAYCGIAGEIVFGVLTLGAVIWWIVLAIRKKWHKGRMLTGMGCAVGIPAFVLLLGSSVMLLLVSVLDVISGFSFAKSGLLTLSIPVLESTGCFAGVGILLFVIGLLVCKSGKKKSAKKNLSDSKENSKSESSLISATAPSVPTEQETLPPVENTPVESDKKDSEGEKYCAHCGEKIDAGSKFCGKCGNPL